ncbi:MAG: TlyA family RNA methyltransferase [Huintestinicola sp.]
MRLDVYLAEEGMVKSRETAKKLIAEGGVTVNGKTADKPSAAVPEGAEVRIIGALPKYVGRGGLKLEKALRVFDISLEGMVCMDIGASTGGFTDCMLQNGAALVYAADVGHGQLDEKLINDSRVINMEGYNIRSAQLSDFEKRAEFISCDVSFISLKMVIPKIAELLPENGRAVMLIKPQFECGKSNIGKNGIVRSAKVHISVINDIISCCTASGLTVLGLDYSPVSGGDGNIEYLLYAGKVDASGLADKRLAEKIVSAAHSELK